MTTIAAATPDDDKPQPCPTCGRCPTCGHGPRDAAPLPYIPTYPLFQPGTIWIAPTMPPVRWGQYDYWGGPTCTGTQFVTGTTTVTTT